MVADACLGRSHDDVADPTNSRGGEPVVAVVRVGDGVVHGDVRVEVDSEARVGVGLS